MSSAAAMQSGWTARRWVAAVLLVWVAQFALVFWLSERPVQVRLPSPNQSKVRLTASKTRGGATPDPWDPTLFALVTQQGFSRSAWLTIPRFEYRTTNQAEPLSWLGLPADNLVDDFSEFVQTNLLSEDLVLHDFNPVLANPKVPDLVVAPSTTVRIEGELAARAWSGQPPLPHPTHTILTNTVVQVLVSAEGKVISAAILSRSDSAQADLSALEFARGAKFLPLTGAGPAYERGEPLMSGRLVFQWARVRWDDPGNATAQN